MATAYSQHKKGRERKKDGMEDRQEEGGGREEEGK